jgi:hypothetical protein
MAALDFPANPSDGDAYENWLWSDAKGAWQAKPMVSAVATTSDVAPLNPVDGDIWYNTYDGSTYVYYVDINSEQWVQVKSDSTLSSTLGTRVEALEATPSGLVPVSPTSVTVGSGSAATNSNGTVSFNATSSVSLNDVFSSNYSTYKIIFNAVNTSAATNFGLRLRSGGTDLTTNGYQSFSMRSRSDNSTVINSFTTADLIVLSGGSNFSVDVAGEITITNPYASLRTYTNGQHAVRESDSLIYAMTSASHTRNTNSYTGITFYPTSGGTFTGTISVFGYR